LEVRQKKEEKKKKMLTTQGGERNSPINQPKLHS
jgi:hypothetical protein